ncbi:MAG: hypothetical protein WDM76_03985 [Limisphaerales bacterium]
MIRQLTLTLCALTLCAINSAFAHSVWIEPKDSQLVIRFAEPGDDFEKSPGYLDNLSPPSPSSSSPMRRLPSKRRRNQIIPDCRRVADQHRLRRNRLHRARRTQAKLLRPLATRCAGAAKPLLTLDLVPTGKPGEVCAYFRGQPLGGIKATLRAPDEKETEITADAEGFLHFEPKQPGQYLLTIAHHREPLAGFHNGVAYKETSHNCSLAWRQE